MNLITKVLHKWCSILSRFDNILLGDNPFFGIDHLSNERGRERSKITTFDNAVEVIQESHKLGMKEMMVGIRPNIQELFDAIKSKTDLLEKINFSPLLPYAQQYVMKTSQKGMVNTLKEVLTSAGIKKDIQFLVKGGLGFLKQDIENLFKIFIDVELLKLKNVNLHTVFLHPALTDLALALNMEKIFTTFSEHLHDKYDVNAGFCTKNFPTLVTKLFEWKLDSSEIMTSFNECGFMMNPTRQQCEDSLKSYQGKVIAMNIFAGGYVNLVQAHKYVSSLPKLRNVVVGVSSVIHAKETFQLFQN